MVEMKSDARIEVLNSRMDLLQDRLSLALEAANVGVWDCNMISGVLTVDARLSSLFGVPHGSITTLEAMRSNIVPADARSIAELMNHCIHTRSPYSFFYRLSSIPGKVLHDTGRCYYASDGSPTRFIGVTVEMRCSRIGCENILRDQNAR